MGEEDNSVELPSTPVWILHLSLGLGIPMGKGSKVYIWEIMGTLNHFSCKSISCKSI